MQILACMQMSFQPGPICFWSAGVALSTKIGVGVCVMQHNERCFAAERHVAEECIVELYMWACIPFLQDLHCIDNCYGLNVMPRGHIAPLQSSWAKGLLQIDCRLSTILSAS